MCLIIFSPKGKKIPPEHIKYAARVNDDGIGIMWRTKGRVFYWKGLFKPEDAIDFLEKEVYTEEGLECVAVHLRYATHGGIRTGLCHPFVLNEHGACVMHNGVLGIKMPEHYKGSDTSWFVYTRIGALDPNWLDNEPLVNQIISETSPSRMLYLYPDNWMHTGAWIEEKDGILYSNDGYEGYKWKGGTGCCGYDEYGYYPLDKKEPLFFRKGDRVEHPDGAIGEIESVTGYDNVVTVRWYDQDRKRGLCYKQTGLHINPDWKDWIKHYVSVSEIGVEVFVLNHTEFNGMWPSEGAKIAQILTECYDIQVRCSALSEGCKETWFRACVEGEWDTLRAERAKVDYVDG